MDGSDTTAGQGYDIIGEADEQELLIFANPAKGLHGSRSLGKFWIDRLPR